MSRNQSSSLLVGLTGGIASGKSTVARLFAELGAHVLDADRIVAELYEPGAAGARCVEELFGSQLLDERGAVDRVRLGALVFADATARRALELGVHPLVGQRSAEWASERQGLLVFEVPLLVESGGAQRYPVVVTVEADPQLRIRRAVERGLEEDQARARMAAQASEQERVAVADFVIRNEGSLEELREQVQNVVEELSRRLETS